MLLVVTALCIWLADYVRPVRRFERQLRDPREEERVLAAQRLGFLGPEARSAAKSLLRTMNDGSARVRKKAVWAMSRVSGRPELLLPFLADRNHDVNLQAVEGFLWAGGNPAHALTTMLDSELLSLLGPDEAAAVLPLLLDELGSDDHSVRIEAAQRLECLAVPASTVVPALIERRQAGMGSKATMAEQNQPRENINRPTEAGRGVLTTNQCRQPRAGQIGAQHIMMARTFEGVTPRIAV
jgi:hypothetical protein